MTRKSNASDRQPVLSIDSEVARQIRQHAHSSVKTEICGVLIGQDRDGVIKIQASIEGSNAEEAGAHVTFTQDTWEHIYKIKDEQFPNERIVGWYHSHPGFGVFLSEHDTFIHKNFFSSPGQVAWVVDPHSDEEGCFGWVRGRIERLPQITFVDKHGGEHADEISRPEPDRHRSDDGDQSVLREVTPLDSSSEPSDSHSLQRLVGTIFSYITAILAGILVAWYVFPRVELVPVPVDPQTGRPLIGSTDDPQTSDAPPNSKDDEAESKTRGGAAAQSSSQPAHGEGAAKGDHVQPK